MNEFSRWVKHSHDWPEFDYERPTIREIKHGVFGVVHETSPADRQRDAEIDARRLREHAEIEEYLYGPAAKPFPREEFDRSRWDDDPLDEQ